MQPTTIKISYFELFDGLQLCSFSYFSFENLIIFLLDEMANPIGQKIQNVMSLAISLLHTRIVTSK